MQINYWKHEAFICNKIAWTGCLTKPSNNKNRSWHSGTLCGCFIWTSPFLNYRNQRVRWGKDQVPSLVKQRQTVIFVPSLSITLNKLTSKFDLSYLIGYVHEVCRKMCLNFPTSHHQPNSLSSFWVSAWCVQATSYAIYNIRVSLFYHTY